ncbi:MAG: iron ABC transporter substrate-binding protein [Oscillospiraceae bacterium]|jgi:iron complex transport system substrate-binding protein|nr:iron ABC transporter substrate-binding protein [Oscillospiraceae bacterium]
MKKQKMIGIFLTLVLILSGCATAPSGNSSAASTAAPASSSSGTTAEARTVTDGLGRQVELPAEIKTVAAIGATARLLTYAGCADRITGLTDLEKKCDPGMPYAHINAAQFSKLTAVAPGGPKDTVYDEAMVTLKPDVIFTGYTNQQSVTALQEKAGIPVVALQYEGIFSESVFASLKLIGDVMGTQDRCSQVTKALKGWQKDLNDRTQEIPDEKKPSVYAGAVSFKGGHGIEGTYAEYPPFTAISAKNVVDETGKSGALLIDKEKLMVWNPDLIFLTPGNMDLVNQDYSSNPDFYNNLNAVKSGKVYSQIAYNYYGTNIEIAVADAYYAGTVMFPDAFADVDFEQKAEEIFTKMLGQPYLQTLKDSGNHFGKLTPGGE